MTPQERRNWTGPILEVYANIESWRDWHWRQFLQEMSDYHRTHNPISLRFANDDRQHSLRYQQILDTMLDASPAPKVPGWMDYKYGEFPEEYK